jgi:cell division protein FtsA
VVDLVLQPLASGYAVLTEDEKDVGVCLVDIGGGTTDVAIFLQGAIRHTAVIPIAGDQLTNDIAIALRTSTQDAEDIKVRYGVALQQLADPEDMIEVPGVGDRPSTQLSRQTLAGFIQPRVEEIFQKVQERGHRAHRGCGADARHDRAGRGDFSHDREVVDAELRRQPARLRA